MAPVRTLADLLQSARAFQESRCLLTALELDLLAAVGEGASAAQAAGAAGTDARATGMLLNALAALGVMEKQGERYRPTPAGRELAQARAGLLHSANLWHSWSTLTECVRAGHAVLERRPGGPVQDFIAAMHAHAGPVADAAVRLVGASGVRRLLDVGGGPASFAIAFARAEAELRAEVLDLPDVVPLAREYIERAGLSQRVTARAGDLRTGPLGQGFDLVLVSAICHMLGEAENRDLLARCSISRNK